MLLGLVVLSTLLVSVAMARGRFLRQWADADRRAADCRAADALLAGWMAGPPEAVPVAGHGVVNTVTWQTRVVRAAPAVAAVVVRLDVSDRPGAPAAVSIEFLVHDVRVAATRPVVR